MLSIPIVAHPSSRAVVEVGHRLFLIVGAIAIGTALSALGQVARALRAFVGAATIIAFVAVLDALAHRSAGSLLPEPAYPLGIHKNAAGFLVACALIVLVVARDELNIARPARTAATITLFLGLAACQSRGSGITLILVLVLWGAMHQKGRLSFTTVVGAVLVGVVMMVSANAMFSSDEKDSRFNSLNSRVETYNATLDLWHDSELTGIGLKYWRDPSLTGQIAFGEPHNLIVSALGESGIIGLAALAFLVGSTARLLRRQRSALGVLALMLLVAKTVDSLLGIFWVAGTLTLPLLMVGVAIGASVTGSSPQPEAVSPRRTALARAR
jgi:O-antigen ligase